MKLPVVATLCLTLTFTACGAQVLDAGSTDAGPPVGKHRTFPPPSNSYGCTPGHETTDCWGTPCKGDVPSAFAGPWTGKITDTAFLPDSQVVRIEVNGLDTFNGLCGAVTFGTAPAPPVATDQKAWPPGTDGPPVLNGSPPPVEGFRYEFWTRLSTFTPDGSSPSQVQIGLMSTQVYKSWCELQDSFPASLVIQFAYECSSPNSAFGGNGCAIPASPIPIGRDFSQPSHCAQMDLCLGLHICDCSADGCTVENNATSSLAHPDVAIDLSFAGATNTATGTLTWGGQSHAVALTRAP